MSSDADTTQVSVNNQLTATDNARVNQQIATQFSGSVIHQATVYTSLPGDPPHVRHEVARAHLDGDRPRRAQEMFGSLLTDGHETNERAYLYVLSVLSDRSYADVTAELSEEIRYATTTAAHCPRDEWRDALDVVNALLRYAHSELGDGPLAQEFTITVQTFGTLSPVRQHEIDRHMELILSGAEQERLAAQRKYQVAVERMSGDRLRRAWKFFEPHPRPPAKWLPPPIRYTNTGWRDATLGCVAAALAIAWVLHSGITVRAGVGLTLTAAFDYLALRCRTVWQTHLCHTDNVRANYQPEPFRPDAKFDLLVDSCFRDADLGGLGDISAGYRGNLKRRLQQQYSSDDVYPGELKWLIMRHAARVGQRRIDLQAESPEAQRAANLQTVGVAMWAIGLAVMVTLGHVIGLFLAAGSWWGIVGIARILSASRAYALLDHEAQTLLTQEWAWYYHWLEILADRPTDAEMAHWLALDKALLKDDALRRANLRERDLVTHVVLTQRAPYARKGRVADGPPRYERYLVYVFLLTRYGMRTTRTHLDLTTGDVGNEQHQMFSYDAVASASVTEKRVRTHLADGRANIERTRRRVFRLTLLDGTCIAEVKEHPSATDDETPDIDEAQETATVQTAGFDRALRVLEAVATEGRDWIARDQERRQRWARNWCTRSSTIARQGHG
ncbi:hypothetical protein [Nocardia jiangxiensis]|uniref:hypothetical protein n=1 Tax=Nocardia jiangxiensis TaxID=282685 RepID=UPI000301ECE8|nr:hypothetical protein [Nocardia jiangxiensis]